jgi:predicted Zn-dependent peptidase
MPKALSDLKVPFESSGLKAQSEELASSYTTFLSNLNESNFLVISAVGNNSKFTIDTLADQAKAFRVELKKEVDHIVRLAGYVELAGKGLGKVLKETHIKTEPSSSLTRSTRARIQSSSDTKPWSRTSP